MKLFCVVNKICYDLISQSRTGQEVRKGMQDVRKRIQDVNGGSDDRK